MDFIYKLVKDIILDRSNSLWKRFGMAILIIIGLLAVDRISNFTYDIHVNNKINAIEKINQLKKEYKSDSLYTIKLNYLENEYKDRKHYYDYCNDYLSSSLIYIKSIFSKDSSKPIKSQTTNKVIINTNHIRSDFWMFVSSNFFFILLCLLVPFVIIFGKGTNTKDEVLGMIMIFIILIGIMSFVTWTAYLIPLIFNNPIWNYILNFLIHSTIIIVISIITYKINKNNLQPST